MKNNAHTYHYFFQNSRRKENNAIHILSLTADSHTWSWGGRGIVFSKNNEKYVLLIFT